MNVSLAPQLERFVQEKVASGRYADTSEGVRAALRLLDRQDRLRRPRESLADAEAEIERGSARNGRRRDWND